MQVVSSESIPYVAPEVTTQLIFCWLKTIGIRVRLDVSLHTFFPFSWSSGLFQSLTGLVRKVGLYVGGRAELSYWGGEVFCGAGVSVLLEV